MITAVTLTNFRSHSSTKVPLERFTLLVGPNSVGKTQVLNAVHLVGQAFGKKTAELLHGERSPQWLIRSKANNAVIRLDGVVPPLSSQVPWWAELHLENDPSRTTLSWELHGIQGKEGGKGSPGSEEARAASEGGEGGDVAGDHLVGDGLGRSDRQRPPDQLSRMIRRDV